MNPSLVVAVRTGACGLAWLACCLGPQAMAQPAAPALERPALIVKHPERLTLLGAAQAGVRLVAVGERGSVLVSDDNAAHWRQVPVPVSVTLTAVGFVDATHGFAVGHGGVVLATTDGGQSWVKRLDGRQAAQIAPQAARAGGDARAVRDAERLVADGADKPLLDLHFFDARHGIVVGASFFTAEIGSADGRELLLAGLRGNVWRSLDGGANWAQAPLPNPASVTGPVLVSAMAEGPSSLLLVNQAGQLLKPVGEGFAAPFEAVPGAPLPPLNGVLPLADGSVLALSINGPLRVPGTLR